MARRSLWLRSSATATTNPVLYLSLVLMTVASASADRSHPTFEFDLHHRLSDPVKALLPFDDFPEEGSLHYYAAMAHRDRAIHGRRLAVSNGSTALTFSGTNQTIRLSSLGFLHYVNISVGTPRRSFLVALDTGSDLFWLPCDCTTCVSGLKTLSGAVINLNIYSPEDSSSSGYVSCTDSLCSRTAYCSSTTNICPFEVQYLSESTGSAGYLVNDELHMVKVSSNATSVTARITFGCGKQLSGAFLESGAPNGLFGLGMSSISVPSTLAREGYVYDSFSMCFGPRGIGKIIFGDAGSLNQTETPFNRVRSHPSYNISVTQLSVGGKNLDLSFSAIFDSGTSFTYLTDPTYSTIASKYDSMVTYDRINSSDILNLPFKYCYAIPSNANDFEFFPLVLTMDGGGLYNVSKPILVLTSQGIYVGYCLAIIKSDSIDIIGQNFMEGYRIVFDRVRDVLGWKAGNCSEDVRSITVNAPASSQTPPASAMNQNRNAAAASSSASDFGRLLPVISLWLLGELILFF